MRFQAALIVVSLSARLLSADDLETAVSRMSRVGFSRSPSFSPDGKTIAFVSNLSGLPQVWTVPAAGGFPRMVTSFDDPVGGVEWSPDGQWIAFSLAPGGGMNTQVYLVKPDGTGLKRLTDGGKETNRLGSFRRGTASGSPLARIAARASASTPTSTTWRPAVSTS